MRSATWLAIVLGGAAGAVMAFAASPPRSSNEPAPSLEPVAARPAKIERDPPAQVPTSPVVAGRASASPSALSQSLRASSRDELTQFEIACQEKKDAGRCRAAAEAYEQGSVVHADTARARLFRKIELTFLVKQCESQVPLSCFALADLYRRGDGVARNPTNAQALLERAQQLCKSKPSAGCESAH
jgi:TPR repeat protein